MRVKIEATPQIQLVKARSNPPSRSIIQNAMIVREDVITALKRPGA